MKATRLIHFARDFLFLLVGGVLIGVTTEYICPGLGWPATAGLYFGMLLPVDEVRS